MASNATAPNVLQVQPAELIFNNVRLQQTYSQTVQITNPLSVPVEFSIRPSNSQRYTVTPARLCLEALATLSVAIDLKLVRFAESKTRPGQARRGHRDFFHIKSDYFDQKFNSTFYFLDSAPSPSGSRRRAASDKGGSHRRSHAADQSSQDPRSSAHPNDSKRVPRDLDASRTPSPRACPPPPMHVHVSPDGSHADPILSHSFPRARGGSVHFAEEISAEDEYQDKRLNISRVAVEGRQFSDKRIPGSHGSAESDNQPLEAHAYNLQQQLQQAHEVLAETKEAKRLLEEHCEKYRRTIHTLSEQVSAAAPDLETLVDAAMEHERHANEVKNQKVVAILVARDAELRALHEQLDQAHDALEAQRTLGDHTDTALRQTLVELQQQVIRMKI
jgi:hypothetical protein